MPRVQTYLISVNTSILLVNLWNQIKTTKKCVTKSTRIFLPRERKSISKIRKSERKKANKKKTYLKPTWRDVKMKKKRS